MKNLFDVIFSFIGLLILLLLFVIVAILIKIDSPGPVFFVQRRIGKNFKPFNLYKFRTMIVGASQKGLSITAGGDSRITRIGRFLRKTKIDELPQLVNVLKGDMSFVGPRPEMQKYVEIFKEEYKEILKVKPGITDLASLSYRDEEFVLKDKENPEDYYINILLPKKIKLSKEYIKNASLTYDLKLIFLTLFRLFVHKKNIKFNNS